MASLAGVQPNLRQRVSLKACMCRLKPYLDMGMAVSHEEAPFSLACSICTEVTVPIVELICQRNPSYPKLSQLEQRQMKFALRIRNRRDTNKEAEVLKPKLAGAGQRAALNWLLAILVGINIPRPPCRAGRASKSLSRLVIPCLPVNAGKNWCRIASSNGCERRSMPGTVRIRNVHLFMRA